MPHPSLLLEQEHKFVFPCVLLATFVELLGDHSTFFHLFSKLHPSLHEASLAEQISGPSSGARVRDAARRKRFAVLWRRILDDVAMTEVERQKVEDAVQKYLKEVRYGGESGVLGWWCGDG